MSLGGGDFAVRASHIVLRIPPGTSDADRQAAVAKLKALRQDILTGKIDFAATPKQVKSGPAIGTLLSGWQSPFASG